MKGLLPVLEPIEKLRMATWLANGVADIHAVDSWNSSGNVDPLGWMMGPSPRRVASVPTQPPFPYP